MDRSTDISASTDADETRDWSDEKRALVVRGLEQARAREFAPDPMSQSERPIAGEAFEQFLEAQLENPDDRAEFERKLADIKKAAHRENSAPVNRWHRIWVAYCDWCNRHQPQW